MLQAHNSALGVSRSASCVISDVTQVHEPCVLQLDAHLDVPSLQPSYADEQTRVASQRIDSGSVKRARVNLMSI